MILNGYNKNMGKIQNETPEALPPAMRVGDHLALDFLNTIASPKGTPIDWLGQGDQLMSWLVDSKVLDSAEAAQLCAKFSHQDLDRAAAHAGRMREWYRDLLFRVKKGGRAAIREEDVNRLNEWLSHDAMFHLMFHRPQEAEPGSYELRTARPWRDAEELLAPIAGAMADLICQADLDLTRSCENPACTMWFYDRTKGHRRRWCSQAICGNRAKVAAFRERQRTAAV